MVFMKTRFKQTLSLGLTALLAGRHLDRLVRGVERDGGQALAEVLQRQHHVLPQLGRAVGEVVHVVDAHLREPVDALADLGAAAWALLRRGGGKHEDGAENGGQHTKHHGAAVHAGQLEGSRLKFMFRPSGSPLYSPLLVFSFQILRIIYSWEWKSSWNA